MAARDLKSIVRKNTEAAAVASTVKAEEDRKAHQAKAPTPAPAPVAPANDATVAAFRAQATANLTKKPVQGALDTIEPKDPKDFRVQVSARMPGATHKAVTFKMDVRVIDAVDDWCRGQNVAALFNNLICEAIAARLEKMNDSGQTAHHVSYDCDDRNAVCGVANPLFLSHIAFVEQKLAQK